LGGHPVSDVPNGNGFRINNLAIWLFGCVFAAWAFVVYHAADAVTSEMAAIHSEQRLTAEKFQQYQLDTLQRITALEAENRQLNQDLKTIQWSKK
jgi:hypothetical protein